MEVFNIGESVMWSGGWGSMPPKLATVVSVGEKNNQPVFDLDNGHWAYGYQLQKLTEDFMQQRKEE